MTNDKPSLHGLKFLARPVAPGSNNWVVVAERYVPRHGIHGSVVIESLTEPQARRLAALLNSAPAMLEACEAALSLLTDDGRQGGKTWTTDSLRAAIAQATGESK